MCVCVFAFMCMYLTGQGKDESPVLLPLFLPERKVQAEALGIPRLPLLPARVKPADRTRTHKYAVLSLTLFDFSVQKRRATAIHPHFSTSVVV